MPTLRIGGSPTMSIRQLIRDFILGLAHKPYEEYEDIANEMIAIC